MDNKTKEMGAKLIHTLGETNRLLRVVAQPWEQYAETCSPQSTPSDESEAAPSPTVLGSRSNAPNAKQQPSARWDRMIKKWKPRVEFVAIFFAIAYAVITFFQWWDANDNFKKGQRAWVMVSNSVIPQDISVTERTPINFSIRNYGLSPALDVATHTHFQFSGKGCSFKEAPPSYLTIAPVAPSQEQPDPGKYIAAAGDQRCIDALHTGTFELKLVGTISYKDIFHNPHITSYCYIYEGKTTHQLSLCESGNEAE